jgi:hypothetical protein
MSEHTQPRTWELADEDGRPVGLPFRVMRTNGPILAVGEKVRVVELTPMLNLLERAYNVLQRREVRIDADCSGKSPVAADIGDFLRKHRPTEPSISPDEAREIEGGWA